MRHIAAALPFVALVACAGELPPEPALTVTSPARGMVQNRPGKLVVMGTALPSPDGDPVASVSVNKVPAMLAADGSFSVEIDVPAGASLIETTATTSHGGSAIDARAVQIGELRPVGANIQRAVIASLSADAFAKLSAVAGPLIKNMDLMTVLGSHQPMATLGDSVANADVSITHLSFGDVKITLAPVDGGLSFSAEIDTLAAAANVHYDGALIPEGTTAVNVTADKITVGGTLVVSPAGTAGFTTTLASPAVNSTNLKLHADGSLVGSVVNLLDANLDATIQSMLKSTAEGALQPLVNDALGALGGPQRIGVLGKMLEIQASPAAVTFTHAGAQVTMNLMAKIDGSEASPGFVFTPNGSPALSATSGIQLALADDLINEMLAEVHALGLLDLHLEQDFGVFDAADIKLALPPMVSANNADGTLRLVLGDAIASLTSHGAPVIRAAINAQVDLAVDRGGTAQQVALRFGKVDVVVNIIGNSANIEGADLSGMANLGIGLQLDSLGQFLVNVPLPAIAGVTLDDLALHADGGYVVASGDLH